MKRLGLGVLVLVVALASSGTGLHADESDDEQARGIESLHAFGVRGLPTAFAGAAAGGARSEAIRIGLEWLAAHQTPDGCWRPGDLQWCNGKERKKDFPTGKGRNSYTGGVTGMVVTAYLGAGYTHRGKHPFAKVVRAALKWLVENQDKDGCVGGRTSPQFVYDHAFGTLALVEAYALTGDQKLRTPAQKAIDFSAFARNPFMTWRYGVKPGTNDTSITGCMGLPLYVALRLNRAGEQAHVFEPLGLDDTVFDGIRNWLGLVVDPDSGRAGYVSRGTGPARPMDYVDKFPGEKSEACTAITVFLRLVLPGFERTPKEAQQNKQLIDKGIELMLGLKPAWTVGAGNIDLYYWYYATMAMRQVGGDAWETWDDALATALLNGQHRDGDPCDLRGSWDPEGVWGKADGGRIYSTAICLLMLETPDRMRPLPAGRTDLLEALATKELPPERRASILRGLGFLNVPKAGTEVAKWVGHEDEQICAAAAEAMGRLDAGSQGVRVLARLLDDKRVVVRRAAVDALGSQGRHLKPAIDKLIGCLDDEDIHVAAGAARALGATGVAAVADVVRPRMQQGDIALRVAAAAAVQRLAADVGTTLPVLIAGLKAKDAAVRVEAAEHIALIQVAQGEIGPAIPALKSALKDDAPGVRIHAAGVLHAADKDRSACVDALVSALDARRGTDRLLAMQVLERIGTPKPTAKLAAQLLTGATSLRAQAAKTLQAAGHGARPAAAALSWCSANGPSILRKAASNAYDALEIGPQEAVRFLLPVLDAKKPDDRAQEGAARAIVFQGAAVVPALTEKLATGSPGMKGWMLDILRRLGRAAAPAVGAIARELKSTKDPARKQAAARALGAIGPAAAKALPQLQEALAHKNAGVRTAALQAIGKLAPGSVEAVQLLVLTATNPDKKLRAMRLLALGALGGLVDSTDRVVPALFMSLEDGDWQVREAAIGALESLWPHCESYLVSALGEASAKVRNGIAHVAQRIGPEAKKLVKPLAKILAAGAFTGNTKYGDALGAIGKAAVRALVKLLKNPVPKVRAEGARALGLIGPDAKRALNSLKRLLSDPDFNVQIKAREAIDRISRK